MSELVGLELGKVKITPRGEWDAYTEYHHLDITTLDEATYLYLPENPSTGNEVTDTDFWQLLAKVPKKGVDYWTPAEDLAMSTAIFKAESAAEVALAALGASGWETVTYMVRLGKGPQVFPVGSYLMVENTTWGDLIVEVLGHNHHPKPGEPLAPTMTLGFRDRVISSLQFDASELSWANTEETVLPAGTYHFTMVNGDFGGQTREDGTYQFTIAQAIPAGGGWRHNTVGLYQSTSEGYKKENITNGTITTYGANKIAIESGLTVTEGSGGTFLGVMSRNYIDTANTIGAFNSTQRSYYGSNNYKESAMRQYVESDAAAGSVWTAQTPFDMPPSWASSTAGFLAGLPEELLFALGEVDIPCRGDLVFETDGVLNTAYTLRSKMFLLSRSEVFGGSESSVADGTRLDYYKDDLAIDRIKFNLSGAAGSWWLRAPYPSYANHVRYVTTDGAGTTTSAHSTYGVAPAFVIY